MYKNEEDLKNKIQESMDLKKGVDFSFYELLLKMINQLKLLKIGEK